MARSSNTPAAGPPTLLQLQGELTIHREAELQQEFAALLANVTSHDSVELDWSMVTRVDGYSLQLLSGLALEMRRRKISLVIRGTGDALAQQLGDFGADSIFAAALTPQTGLPAEANRGTDRRSE